MDRRQIVSHLDINGDGRVEKNEVKDPQRYFEEHGFDATSDIRMASPKRQGDLRRNFPEPEIDATSNIRMASPKRQADLQRNRGEPGFEATSNIRMASPKRQGNLQRNFGEPGFEATNRNQYRNPTELTRALFLDCDLDKDGELNPNELAKCVSSVIYF